MNNAKSRTSLVLMEIIVTILFFSLASAVCVKLFVHSHLISEDTRRLNKAIGITQSISEIMNGTDGSISEIRKFFPDAEGDDNYFVIYYDSNFNETFDDENAEYAADVTVTNVGRLYNMTVTFVTLPDCETVYTLKSSKYIRRSEIKKTDS